jgi:hypothetical protein
MSVRHVLYEPMTVVPVSVISLASDKSAGLQADERSFGCLPPEQTEREGEGERQTKRERERGGGEQERKADRERAMGAWLHRLPV